MLKVLRQYFLTGLVALLPVLITVLIVRTVAVFLNSILGSYLPSKVFGLGLLLAVVVILFVGLVVQNVLGRTIVSYLDRVMSRIPLVNGIYDASKQLVHTFLSQKGRSFREVVWVPFPGQDTGRSLAFRVGENRSPTGAVPVFIPYVPPTAGLLLFFAPEEVHPAGMAVDEAWKLLMSMGTLQPRSWAVAASSVEEARLGGDRTGGARAAEDGDGSGAGPQRGGASDGGPDRGGWRPRPGGGEADSEPLPASGAAEG